ncbi:hypothetical protein KXV29_006227 [Aspergillus fumigatus]|nr:hypothetical protein KXV29_006227 [Aspergillus fumigatus]
MTQWANYLQGIQAHDLLACIAALEEDPMDATEQGVQVIWDTIEQGIQTHDLLACVAAPEEDPMDATEQAVQVIWDTMEQVACKSQQTV